MSKIILNIVEPGSGPTPIDPGTEPIVPNTGLNAACDALVSWANVARPVSDGNFLVKLNMIRIILII